MAPQKNDFLERLDSWKKDELSDYCLKDCETKDCCSRLVIGIDKNELNLFKENKPEYKRVGEMILIQPPCPMQDVQTGKCRIWENKPKTCEIYPTYFIEEENVRALFLANNCRLAVDLDAPALHSLIRLCEEDNVEFVVRY